MTDGTEDRIKRMMRLIRVGTSAFMLLPLLGWAQLAHPWVAAAAAAAAIGEALWFDRRAAAAPGPLDRRTVLVDAAFCVLLMYAGSRAAAPELRNVVMTELVPFSLGAAAVIGISRVGRPLGLAAVAALMASWTLAVLPDARLKLASDLLGFALWYAVGRRVAATWRHLADATTEAQEETEKRRRDSADQQQRDRDARHRDQLHSAIHDIMLPVVNHMASGREVGEAEVHWARWTVARARRWLEDPRSGETHGLEAALRGVVEQFTLRGMIVVETVIVVDEPPPDIVNALEGAVVEALNNAVAHAGRDGQAVVLFAESGPDGLVVSVQDRGRGFDPAAVRAGGGLGRSLRTIEHHGGRVTLDSRPGRGTKILWEWDRPAGGETEERAC
ncbi:hypothetical protein KNE206_05850 [Kitasatospora sp. NE20-6]|uniref:sensor histidine kinase n=1 Tax=Kitasatospora sp. NE20-6 TaxID=2859066 RepID=UPI0034DBB6A2